MKREVDFVVRCTVVAAFALFLLGASECNGRRELPAPPQRAYVIFIDLSLSLNETQAQVVPEVMQKLVQGMPGGSRISVYPIAEEVVATGALLQAHLPKGENATERARLQKRRAELAPQVIEAVASMRQTLRAGTTLRHTCISDALRQAAKEVRDLRSVDPSVDVEIVFVSDMLEDCQASLLGRPVSLEKPNISPEVVLARSLPRNATLVDLGRAHVTMLLPPLALAVPKTARPETHDLEAFWRAVLDRCNDEREAFRFGTEIPERLRPKG